MNYYISISKTFSIIGLISLVFSMTVWIQSVNIFLSVLIVGINLIYTFLVILKRKKIKIGWMILWYITLQIAIILEGMISPYSEFYGFVGYSLKFHIIVIFATLISIFYIHENRDELWDYLNKVAIWGSILLILYILIKEKNDLLKNLPLLFTGDTIYRLGDGNEWNPNAICLPIALFSIINIINITTHKEKRKMNIVVFVLQSFFVFLTGSKKGIFLLVLAIFLSTTVVSNIRKKVLMMFIISAFFTIFIYNLFANPFLYNMIGIRIQGMLETLGIIHNEHKIFDVSTNVRSNMIKEAFSMFLKHPFLGNGWNYFAANSQYETYSHNNISEILVSMGIWGLFLYGFAYFKLMDINIHITNLVMKKINYIILISVIFLDITSVTVYGSIIVFIMFEIVNANQLSCKHIKTLEKKKYDKLV